MNPGWTFMALLLCFWASPAVAATIVYGPIHYYSQADSPFLPGIQAGTIYLEDFEDKVLDVPYVNIVSGRITVNRRPSVDGDDGQITNTPFGYSFWSTVINPFAPSFTITFSPDANGHYPHYFGVAFPDSVGDKITTLPEEILGVTDRYGNIVVNSLHIPMFYDPLASAFDPKLHSFLGVYSDTGISQVVIQNAIYIDHLQYGYEIPEPTPGALLAAAGLALTVRRRRRQRRLR